MSKYHRSNHTSKSHNSSHHHPWPSDRDVRNGLDYADRIVEMCCKILKTLTGVKAL